MVVKQHSIKIWQFVENLCFLLFPFFVSLSSSILSFWISLSFYSRHFHLEFWRNKYFREEFHAFFGRKIPQEFNNAL